jgi:hypothetical protein
LKLHKKTKKKNPKQKTTIKRMRVKIVKNILDGNNKFLI